MLFKNCPVDTVVPFRPRNPLHLRSALFDRYAEFLGRFPRKIDKPVVHVVIMFRFFCETEDAERLDRRPPADRSVFDR